jgi:hypothetical protein
MPYAALSYKFNEISRNQQFILEYMAKKESKKMMQKVKRIYWFSTNASNAAPELLMGKRMLMIKE